MNLFVCAYAGVRAMCEDKYVLHILSQAYVCVHLTILCFCLRNSLFRRTFYIHVYASQFLIIIRQHTVLIHVLLIQMNIKLI